jgi:hypothetical protein
MSKTSADESIDMRFRTINTFIDFNSAMMLKDMGEREALEIMNELIFMSSCSKPGG